MQLLSIVKHFWLICTNINSWKMSSSSSLKNVKQTDVCNEFLTFVFLFFCIYFETWSCGLKLLPCFHFILICSVLFGDPFNTKNKSNFNESLFKKTTSTIKASCSLLVIIAFKILVGFFGFLPFKKLSNFAY